MEYIVEAKGLHKYYNDVKAVDGLDLYIRKGEIYGLLGPNGAGKTTTILLLLGLTEPTSGEIRVCGFDPRKDPLKVKRLIGYLPENVGFYEDLTAWENLYYVGRLNGLKGQEAERRIKEALYEVGLEEVAHRPVKTFSKGMKQRLGIAEVMFKDPQFAILDEPTSGIDPEGAHQILELIQKMNREKGMTILLSSHLLYQVQKICHRVGIISKGQIVAEGTLEELRTRSFTESKFQFKVKVKPLTENLIEEVRKSKGVIDVRKEEDVLVIASQSDIRSQIAKTILDRGFELIELRGMDYTLEDIYLRYFQEV
jgi:ABC-2 type transport system ATP-binding protein